MEAYLLVAVNAKYIHSNLAVYSLKAYAEKKGYESSYAEYTINQPMEAVLRDLYERAPRVLFFSCYIWNLDYLARLAGQVHQVLPDTQIWFGGPEVTYAPEAFLAKNPYVSGVMIGEGEETFTQMLACFEGGRDLRQVKGLCLNEKDGKPVFTGTRKGLSMDELVFPYESLNDFENRIIYYESGRGCPFSCSYCLSSVEKCLRFRSLSLVKKELTFFLERRALQVKFIDRTFNCNHSHAYEIWKFIHEHDNGLTNFHFEISADLLREEDLKLFEKMRPGLIQLEIGVQTTNPDTIKAIGRKMDLVKLAEHVARVRSFRNIHQHLDLIAGLPYEGFERFRKSFNDVYAMKPDQLQLGFLKVLKGTRMEQEAGQHGIVYRPDPVYEVLYTKWLTFGDILKLKTVEETVEEYYNSGQFESVLRYAVGLFESPFDLYEAFGSFLRQKGYRDGQMNRIARYMAFRVFLLENKADPALTDTLLTIDYCMRERLKKPLPFVPDQNRFRESKERTLLSGRWEAVCFPESKVSLKQLGVRAQVLVLEKNAGPYLEGIEAAVLNKSGDAPYMMIFDYETRDPMNHNARVHVLTLE